MKHYFLLLRFCSVILLFLGASSQMQAQTLSITQSGTQGGFYYDFWKEKPDSASMTLLEDGHYTTSWKTVTNFIAGLGWEKGSPDRVIDFQGSFHGGSNATLAVYGWTRKPMVEYYVVENHGSWIPPGGNSLGTFRSDGGTYRIYQNTKLIYPAINGYTTYWSVRENTRSSGTVTFANHVAAWKEKGLDLGSTWDYQIMATEAYQSTGSSDITISERIVTDVSTPSSSESNVIDIYPNPAINKLVVILPWPQAELGLYTSEGNRILEIHTEKATMELDLVEYGAGIYLLKVESEGKTLTKKVVVF